MIYENTFQFNPIGHVDIYVLFVNSNRECDVLLRTLRMNPTWNAHAKFLIVIEVIQHNQTEFVTHIFSSFWQQYVINIVVVTALDKSNKDLQVTDSIFEMLSTFEYSRWFWCKTAAYVDAIRRNKLWPTSGENS